MKHLRKGENDHTLPLAPHSIKWDAFQPRTKVILGTKTTDSGSPRKLWHILKLCSVGLRRPSCPKLVDCASWQCVRELWEAMEVLVTFTDEDVLATDPLSPWKKITSLRCSRVVEEEAQETMRDRGCSRFLRACPRVPF